VSEGREPTKDEKVTADSSVHVLLNPLVEELKCALATTGDSIKVFPGLEAFANLEHVLDKLRPLLGIPTIYRIKVSLNAIATQLAIILAGVRAKKDEIAGLVTDFTKIREILGHRKWNSKRIRIAVHKWVKMLRKRLGRRGMVNDPTVLKKIQCGTKATSAEIWQEWIRLHYTHEKGLYIAYDYPELGFTNNEKEWLFGRERHHYRKMFGRGSVTKSLVVHGKYYCRVIQLDLSSSTIRRILENADAKMIQDGFKELYKFNHRARRNWRIREKDTGNFKRLEENLRLCS
jgi:hypothetical protein